MAQEGPPKYRRRHYIVNRPLQYRFIGAMLGVLVVLTGIALGSVYLTLWATLRTFGLEHDPVTVALFSTVGWSLAFELLLVAPFVIWMGVLLTHKVAGPLVRIHAVLARMTKGDFNVQVKLRKRDALVELADAVNALALSLRQRS
jgi:methyl-accepting chemotaxis protein